MSRDPAPAAGSRDRCAGCGVQAHCIFHQLPDPLRKQYQGMQEIRFYPAGSCLVEQGDAAQGLFHLRSGAVRLASLAETGKKTILRLMAAPALIGLKEVTAGSPYPFTVRAVVDTVVEYTPRRLFVPFVMDHPQVAVGLMIWLCQECEELEQRLRDNLSHPPMDEQLLEHLRRLGQVCGKRRPDGVLLPAALRVQDIADGLGCSRQWASKLLGKLEARGVVSRIREGLLLGSGLFKSERKRRSHEGSGE